MKLTKSYLKKLIKEEISRINETPLEPDVIARPFTHDSSTLNPGVKSRGPNPKGDNDLYKTDLIVRNYLRDLFNAWKENPGSNSFGGYDEDDIRKNLVNMETTIEKRADAAVGTLSRFHEFDAANVGYLRKLARYLRDVRRVLDSKGKRIGRPKLDKLLDPKNIPVWDPKKAKQALLRYIEDTTAIEGTPPVDPEAFR